MNEKKKKQNESRVEKKDFRELSPFGHCTAANLREEYFRVDKNNKTGNNYSKPSPSREWIIPADGVKSEQEVIKEELRVVNEKKVLESEKGERKKGSSQI